MKKIVVDVFGADGGSRPILEGAANVLSAHPELGLVLVGDREEISDTLAALGADAERVEILHADEQVTNLDPPSCIFKGKNRSGMALALEALRDREDCIGLLSPGCTGVLLVGSIFRLGLFPGLKVPALSSSLPGPTGGWTCLVDCGANLDCAAEDLVRFARMGSAYAEVMYGSPAPRVALLSVGREPGKGSAVCKEAFAELEKSGLNFVGNAEGSDLMTGFAEVLVADGYAGNVLLKSTEAAGKAAMEIVRRMTAGRPEAEKLSAELLGGLSEIFELNDRGGATFLGTKKCVIKMHGCASARTVTACADQLCRLEEAGFTARLRQLLE